MEIRIEVRGERYYPGTTHVLIDGKEFARLRGDESFVITVEQDFTTQTILPPYKEFSS